MKNLNAAFCIIGLVAVATLNASGTMVGYTYDTGSNILPNAIVKMQDKDFASAPYYDTSDANGYYSKILQQNTYIVTAYRGCISSTKYNVYSVDTVYVPDRVVVSNTTTSIVALCI